jgi:hypothetical protein
VYDSGGEKRKALKAYAGRGDEIWVDVINFKDWRESLKDEKSEKLNLRDLILYLNHVPLKGVHPFYWYETDWEIAPSVKTTATTFGFSLVRNEDSKPAWSHLLNKPGFNRKVVVSVGFENGQEIRTELTPDETSNLKDLQDERESILSSSDLSLSDKHALEVIDQKLEVETTPKNLKALQDRRESILSSSDLSSSDKQKLKGHLPEAGPTSGSALLFDDHSKIQHRHRLDRDSRRADRLSRTGPVHQYYSRSGRGPPAGWSEALQPGTRTDGVLVFSRDRVLFLPLDCIGRHGFA